MAKNLVIVESPAKSKTIKKFLGSNYTVVASNGHVRDLPKSQMGIDFDNDFDLKYITIRGKGPVLASIRKELKKANKVYLATDPDREGEAIAWHLCYALKLDPQKTKRITFNEITKNAVKQGLKNPRDIDMNLVDAQQARRSLDRMVGYSISPVLWVKVKSGLSAGRVQSVALKIIADREAEIDAFIPEEYWTLDVELKVPGYKKPLIASYKNGKNRISAEQVDQIVSDISNSDYEVKDIKITNRTKKSPLPFTTSTLQQVASGKLNFSTQKTMQVAQQLYEGVAVAGHGTIGLITYLRTDSIRISEEADQACKNYIQEAYGPEYVVKEEKKSQNSEKKIQDAHEAIRPTDVTLHPSEIKDSLSRDQFRLYQLIWKRFVASRMEAAIFENRNISIEAGTHIFTCSGSKIVFRGYKSVYDEDDAKTEEHAALKKLKVGMKLEEFGTEKKQHFTTPPDHYTEASLVRALEEFGIGRPSTYAPTISTLIHRHYVVKEKKNLYMSELGTVINQIMSTTFPQIVDKSFTAIMETMLDSIADGDIPWKEVLRNFYPDLKKEVDQAQEELEKIKIEDEVTDVICDQCGKNMVIKYGKYGKFLACPGFPECRNTLPYYEKIGVTCPECGGDIVIKKTQKGRVFYGCSNHPDCQVMTWQRPSNKRCPRCGKMLLEKGKKLVCQDSECGYWETWNPAEEEEKE